MHDVRVVQVLAQWTLRSFDDRHEFISQCYGATESRVFLAELTESKHLPRSRW